MSVVADIKEVGPCKQQLSIAVPAAAVEAETLRVVQSFRRHAKAPGFRKGKMPESIVRQRYRDDIEKEVLDRLVPRYWKQASAEKDLDPLLPPRVEEVDFVPDSRLTFIATVETRPEIALGDVDNFDLPEDIVEPTEEEVSEALEQLRKDASDWSDVERPATAGDMVEAEVEEIGGDDTRKAEEVAFEVGNEHVWRELSAAVERASAGDTVSFERQPEGDDEDRRRRFEVRLKAVKQRDLPDLDDELAAKLGDFETVEALAAKVSESLEASKRAENRRRRERELLAQLRQRHPLTLPEGVIEMEIEGLLREYGEGLAQQGVDVAEAEIDWQALAGRVRPQAEERVQSRLLLDAVADAKEIEVLSEELEQALAQLAAAQETSIIALRQAMGESGQLDRLRMQLKRHKTLITLLGEEASEETMVPEPVAPAEGE